MSKINISYVIFIVLILFIFFGESYIIHDDTHDECNKNDIDFEVKKMVKNNNKKITDKMILSCKEGLIKGGVTGCMTGGLPGAVAGGVLFGIANPVLLYISHDN